MNNDNEVFVNTQTPGIRHLTPKQWEATRVSARAIILSRLKEPTWAEFAPVAEQGSPSTKYVVYALLFIVAFAAFLISAGKQVAAFSLIVTPLLEKYPDRISPAYVTVVIVAALTLAEFGVILFGYAAKVISQDRTSEYTLRVFQGLCVIIALGGNITVTALNIVPDAAVFEWIVAITAPLIVMGVGVIVEQSALRGQEHYAAARTAFDMATEKYRAARAEPETDPAWLETWGKEILEGLKRIPGQRVVIESIEESDPAARGRLASIEYNRQAWIFQPVVIETSQSVSPKSLTRGETAKRLVSPSQSISGDTSETGEMRQGEMPRQTAKRLLAEQPDLMAISLSDLVTSHGLNRSAWARAKTDIETARIVPESVENVG